MSPTCTRLYECAKQRSGSWSIPTCYEVPDMPRKRIGFEQKTPTNESLAASLAAELKSNQESGQPLIYEQELRPEKLRVTVIWDDWDRMPLEERTSVILRAYELAE